MQSQAPVQLRLFPRLSASENAGDVAQAYLVTVAVTDDDGAMSFAEQAVSVSEYEFVGFLPPVDNPPTTNTMQAGRAVPIKFRLGGDRGLDIFDPGYPSFRQLNCENGIALDEIEETVSAGGSMLQYEPASDTYTYVWKTDASWEGSCRRFILQLDDGSRYFADFKLRYLGGISEAGARAQGRAGGLSSRIG